MKPLLLLISVLFALPCHAAETRWCTVTSFDSKDVLVYPPIAKAARVSGVVVERVRFTPDGNILGYEPVFGPAMLSISLGRQMQLWHPQTTATGNEPCQTLIIAHFRLFQWDDTSPHPATPPARFEASVVHLYADGITTEPVICADPIGVLFFKNPFQHMKYIARHWGRKLFHRTH